jgi:hypothetical protein
MAANYSAEHLTSRLFVRSVDFDPDTGDDSFVTLNPGASEACLSLTANGSPRRYLFDVFRSVGTGGVTTVTVIAATAADGTGAVTVKQVAATTANAVGDHVFVEVDVEQVKEVLAGATHIGLKIDLVTATDECVVTVIGAEGQFQYSGLTADYIS